MLPTVGTDTLKICRYASEVVGRARGVAAMPDLISDATRRDAIRASADKLFAAVNQLSSAYTARVLHEYVDQRVAYGNGRGVDRGFDGLVSWLSETARTSLPDRSVKNPEYRAIFPNGAEEYTSPTIKEDEQIATELRNAVGDSKLAAKAEMLSRLNTALPVVTAAATGVRDAEQKVNTLFQAELAARKLVVDTLWEERKAIELALGRGGRQLARFVYFDVRKAGAEEATGEAKPTGDATDGEEPEAEDAAAPAPAEPKEPK